MQVRKGDRIKILVKCDVKDLQGQYLIVSEEGIVCGFTPGHDGVPDTIAVHRPTQRHWVSDFCIESGYEWICPNCKAYHREIEVTQTVTCKDCGHVFYTNPPEHAIG